MTNEKEPVKKAAKAEKKSGSTASGKSKASKSKDELDDVETIPKEQALAEIRAAAEKARKAEKQ
ncbi:hypothetical protein ccbrp13_22470 [Ktedonobacteria bacterium brp13]|nr:hypothetical protein ccbrp13_22470 [Ktedonobacteria bacterium brp13]